MLFLFRRRKATKKGDPMNEKRSIEERNVAGRMLNEMITEALGYVELFLEDLENEETVIDWL